ncbi:MAG: DMT family transporter [Kiritimatiellae bacterium]|nr:DMT family transporter [Kiritimatiellia bacterium]
MSWIAWILASAVLLAFYDLAKKASVRDNAVLPVLLVSTLFGCAAFLLGLWASGRFAPVAARVDSRLAGLAAVKSLIVATSWVFTFRALRTLPISIATPIRASAPALVFLLAACLYGERPGALQALGMLIVFGGYFVFSWAGRHEGIDFRRSRAVWCAVAGMCFSALSAIWDKFIFRHDAGAPADPHLVESVQLLFQVGLVVVYGLLLAAGAALGRRRARTDAPRFAWRWTIPCVGILLACADWLYFRGIHEDGVLISVASLMRRFSVVITFVLGAKFFHETNLLRKSLALAAVLLGIALICLGA